MANPTTRNSTPPASSRIGQQAPINAIILQAYDDAAFPGIAFTNQLAIDLTTKTLVYYNADGAWQGVTSAADVQSFYGPVQPTTTNLFNGDRWFNTTTGVWNVWSAILGAWVPGNIAYSEVAPTAPTVGEAWYDTSTQTLKFWDGTAWVAAGTPTAPTVTTGTMPASAVQGSSWTDYLGIQYVCILSYTSGGTMANWRQLLSGSDPLASLINQNGQLIEAQELTVGVISAGPSTQAPIATGLVWLDITDGQPTEGNYYVYTGAAWQQVTNPATLVLCSGLKVSQNAPGILGTNLNYIWPDALASLITLNSIFALGTNSANSAAPGPTPPRANVANVAVTSNVATVFATGPTAGFQAGRNITLAGLATTSLNGSWKLSVANNISGKMTFNANVANVATTADTGTITEPFIIGDVAEDADANDWWLWDQINTVTGTWADWVPVTNPSTVVMCATIATQQLSALISARCIAVGQDIATGQYQNVPADLNAALLDLQALGDATYQPADIALANYAVASGQYQANSVLYFVGQDAPLMANVGTVGLSVMNTYSGSDVQDLIGVTDEGFTGTSAKIQAANFLLTYTTARGTL